MRGSSAPCHSAAVPPHHADHSSPALGPVPVGCSSCVQVLVDLGHQRDASIRRAVRVCQRDARPTGRATTPSARATSAEATPVAPLRAPHPDAAGPPRGAVARPARPASGPRPRLRLRRRRPTATSSPPTPTTSPPTCPATRTRRSTLNARRDASRSRTTSFDAVLSTQVLEHVADPGALPAERFRVLRPGGRLLLSTHGIFVYHPDPDDYWRWTVRRPASTCVDATPASGRALRGDHRACCRPACSSSRTRSTGTCPGCCGRRSRCVMQALIALTDRLHERREPRAATPRSTRWSPRSRDGSTSPAPRRAALRRPQRRDAPLAARRTTATTTCAIHYLHGPDIRAARASAAGRDGRRARAARSPSSRSPTSGSTACRPRASPRKATWYRIFLPELLPGPRPGALPRRRPARPRLARAAVGARPRRAPASARSPTSSSTTTSTGPAELGSPGPRSTSTPASC